MNDNQLLAQWEESLPSNSFAPTSLTKVALGALVLIILAIVWGIYSHDWTYFLSAGVFAALGLVIYSQQRHLPQQRTIKVTTQSIEVGAKSYPLPLLAGFWLELEDDHVVVNVEFTHHTLFPLAILFPHPSKEEARELFLHVLNELEPRENTFSNPISRYLRF